MQVRQGDFQTNTLALKGRRGTLLAKGVTEFDGLTARGFTTDAPFRVELYRAEDSELVEQVLQISGPLSSPDTIRIGQ